VRFVRTTSKMGRRSRSFYDLFIILRKNFIANGKCVLNSLGWLVAVMIVALWIAGMCAYFVIFSTPRRNQKS
jgi:hypothetical protein